jgi:hypothetical protein
MLALLAFDDFDVLHPHFPKLVRQKLDSAPDIWLVFRKSADAWNPQQAH